jgi:hypothetical protein
MASILQVEELRGPTSGANANKVIIPSGQTLDASAGFIFPAGTVIQVARNWGTNGQGTNSTSFVQLNVSVTITPKFDDSIIIVQFFATAYVDGGVGTFSITRDGTLIGNGAANTITQMGGSGTNYQPSAISAYATAGSTNSTTFRVAVRNDGGNTFFPAGSVDQWTAYAMEVKQ